jgi:hypothetical protein
MAHHLIFDGVNFVDSFINKEICIFDFFFAIQSTSLASESLVAEVLQIEFPDNSVIEFDPFILARALLD